jgi:hypothetical protein
MPGRFFGWECGPHQFRHYGHHCLVFVFLGITILTRLRGTNMQLMSADQERFPANQISMNLTECLRLIPKRDEAAEP